MKKALGLTALLAAALATSATAQNFDNWSQKSTITINTSAGGANVAGTVTNYPLLLRIVGGSFISAAKPGGDDLRFSSMDETVEYSYEIEYWNNIDTGIVWVRVPSIAGDNASQQIKMHAGNPAASPATSGPDVFRPADGWLGVWHMTGGTSVSNTTPDATGNGHTGTLGTVGSQGQTIVDTLLIGTAKSFRGTNATNSAATGGFFYMIDTTGGKLTNRDTATGINTVTGPYTISAWVVPKQCNNTGRVTVISQYANVNTGKLNGRGWALQTGENSAWRLSNNAANLAAAGTANVSAEFKAEGTCTAATATYVSATYSSATNPTANNPPATMSMWLNNAVSGTANTTAAVQGQSIGTVPTNSRVYIARVDTGGDFRAMRGAVDEVRVRRAALNADWKKLDYETQRNGGSAVTIGTFTSILPSGKTLIQRSPVNARVAGGNVVFTLTENSVGKLSVLDVNGRTVWSRDVAAGNREVTWQAAGKGVYFARFSPKDASVAYVDTKFSLVK